jgi:hypothetical protein
MISFYEFLNLMENRDWRDTSFKDLRRELPREELYGWLSPKGRFINTGREMNHLAAIRNTPELMSLMPPGFKKKIAKMQEAEKSSKEAELQGEHPEWHSYERLEDAAETEAYDFLYSRGYLRVATVRRNDEVHFEGTSSAIMNLYQRAKRLAEENGYDAKFQKIELFTDDPRDY